MATVGAIVAVVGAAAGAYSQHQAGQRQKKIDEQNAAFAAMAAEDAIKRGAEDEQRFREKLAGFSGTQRAAIAGQGLDLEFGSAATLQSQTAYLGELDALTIRNNAAREAWGYRVQQWNYGEQARNAARAGNEGAMTTLLTGASQAYGYKYGRGR